MKARPLLLSAIVVSLLLLQLTFAAPPRYEIIDLGTLCGDRTEPYGINDKEQVVGYSYNADGEGRAFLFENGVMVDIGTLANDMTIARAINDEGQIVGQSKDSNGVGHAFLYDNGTINGLGTLGGRGSWAYAINNKGQIVGDSHNGDDENHAFIYENGLMIDLGTLGGTWSRATGINNSGLVVGFSRDDTDNYVHAFLHNGDRMVDLGTLGSTNSKAYGINNRGQIVGVSKVTDSQSRAFIYQNGVMIKLNTLGGNYSKAFAINDRGQVVGESWNNENQTHAFLYENGVMIDLNNQIESGKGWELISARCINEIGQIAGTCKIYGKVRGFLMTPIYEPVVYYVDDDAAGANDGSSWADAYNYLQDALAAAWSGDEIRVAKGIYTPDSNSADPNGSGDRTATFQLINGVTIKGGYAGANSPDPNARDIELYKTILSGDLAGDDIELTNPADMWGEQSRRYNSEYVVTGSYVDANAILDGFTITAGYNSTLGAGMCNRYGNPTVTNCTFTWNCSEWGGGMGNWNGSPKVIDCKFVSNAAMGGGGIDNVRNCAPILINCAFSNNSGLWMGGGMLNGYAGIGGSANPILINCIFNGNSTDRFGGGMYNVDSSPIITNCTFTGNAAGRGGGIYSDNSSSPILINCILWNNKATYGHEIYLLFYSEQHPSEITVSFSDVQGGAEEVYVETGSILNWEVGNIDADPLFVVPGYWDANDVWIDGDYHLLPGSPCIDSGDPNYISEPNETGLDGRPRVIGGRVDIGAYEYAPTILAEARILPRTINIASKGNWITAYIWLPEDYNVTDIEPNSILLEDKIQPREFSVDEQAQLAMARFNREDVQAILDIGDIELEITGQLTDGTTFEGTDIIKVTDAAGKKPAKGQ